MSEAHRASGGREVTEPTSITLDWWEVGESLKKLRSLVAITNDGSGFPSFVINDLIAIAEAALQVSASESAEEDNFGDRVWAVDHSAITELDAAFMRLRADTTPK